MNEFSSSPEFDNEVAKEVADKKAAINAYKKFVEKGITHPDDLDLKDPEVKEAHDLFFKWQESIDKNAGNNEELKIRAKLEKTMFYVDAGFTNIEYLDDILNDFLAQDAVDTEKIKDNSERSETRRLIAEAIIKVKKIIKSQKNKFK